MVLNNAYSYLHIHKYEFEMYVHAFEMYVHASMCITCDSHISVLMYIFVGFIF